MAGRVMTIRSMGNIRFYKLQVYSLSISSVNATLIIAPSFFIPIEERVPA